MCILCLSVSLSLSLPLSLCMCCSRSLSEVPKRDVLFGVLFLMCVLLTCKSLYDSFVAGILNGQSKCMIMCCSRPASEFVQRFPSTTFLKPPELTQRVPNRIQTHRPISYRKREKTPLRCSKRKPIQNQESRVSENSWAHRELPRNAESETLNVC